LQVGVKYSTRHVKCDVMNY